MYVQSKDHLENIVLKAIKEGRDSIDTNELLPLDFIVEHVFKAATQTNNIVDQFSWEIKQNPALVEESNFWEWYKNKTVIDAFPSSDVEHILTAEFSNRLRTLGKVPGVYFFFNKSNCALYIGMSVNLQERALSSFRERFSKYNKPVYFTVCVSENAADAAILESYFINTYKPTLNGATKYDDFPMLNISPIPRIEALMLCNKVGE